MQKKRLPFDLKMRSGVITNGTAFYSQAIGLESDFWDVLVCNIIGAIKCYPVLRTNTTQLIDLRWL